MKAKYNTATVVWTLGLYYLTLAVFLAGALFPVGRVWGVSVYAGLPDALVRNAFITATLAPILYFWLLRRHFAAAPTPRARKFRRFVTLAFVALAATVFTLFRAQTHFGGDGYTLLGLLAADNPLLKSREIGESLLHLWLKHVRGGDAQIAALFSYQFISIGAGALFVGAALYSAHRLFSDSLWRALFALGLCSGGYMLLYFGYVENYSVLILSVSVFATLGVLSLRGAFSRWWLALVTIVALWLHLLATFVLPALAYGLLAGTRWGRSFAEKSRGFHWALIGAALIGGTALLAYLYQQSMFFQLAVLLPWATTFTINGYTLFAVDHLLDLANLAVLLAPWLALALPLILITRGSEEPELAVRREYRFLTILAISALTAVCVLDPKLGLPRDWDLFAFAGPPAAALFFLTALRGANRGFERVLLALCAASLGIF
ncbi:MAG TPA: hypothetical protein VLB27_11900, partial [candidate division Zixibacteria bacterium]|nr:hypothetical protein [candidate division Zixibacteria bacterium]